MIVDRTLPALVALASAMTVVPRAAAQATQYPRSSLVTVNSSGGLSNGNTTGADISPSGRFVAFSTGATSFLAVDGNGFLDDVFVRDRLQGLTYLVSKSASGQQGNESSVGAAVAGDAAWVAYQSRASNLASPDTNGDWDIFVTEPIPTFGQTIMVSVSSAGVQGAGPSQAPFISAGTGRFVVFASTATNLVASDTNGVRDVFVHDRDTDGDFAFDEPGAISTVRASLDSSGNESNAQSTSGPITSDGRYVVFWSSASNLAPGGDANAFVQDVFVRDLVAGTTSLIAQSSAGVQANDDWIPPAGPAGPGSGLDSSSDGRFVAFSSYATNLVAGDTNASLDLFVRDTVAGTNTRAGVTAVGAQLNGPSYNPAISPDGRFVVFASEATNLPMGLGPVSFYLRDRDADRDGILDEAFPASTTLLLNGGSATTPFLVQPRMTDTGSAVVYPSQYAIAGADTNGFFDIYVTDTPLDSDGDGLLDGWELVGIDVLGEGTLDSTTFMPSWLVNPYHKDLLIEIDAMTGRAPSPAAYNLIIGALIFAPVPNPDGQTGINLWTGPGPLGTLIVDDGNLPVPAQPWTWPTAGTVSPEFVTAKTAFFGTLAERLNPNWTQIRAAKLLVYRYCIFADRLNDALGNPSTISGLAEMPGNDFMVTLGAWPTVGGTSNQQAGVFLHEFGHTLGLGHGGGDMVNYKPNYHSVMNYTWTVPITSPPQNMFYFNSWSADFSGIAAPTLNESSLNENAGLGGHPGHWGPVGPVPIVVPETGPADYNNDGQYTSGVAQDMNLIVPPAISPASGVGTILTGFDDWSNLQFALGLNASSGAEEPIVEISYEIVEALSSIGGKEPCPWDLDGDQLVGITDLLSLLAAWGDPWGITDLLELLASWGGCP